MSNPDITYRVLFRLIFLGMILVSAIPVPLSWAGNPYKAYYSTENDRLFWFLQITDLHIGTVGERDHDNLAWILSEARNIIQPEFIVATGDLTDCSNGTGALAGINGPYTEEWMEYRQILSDAGIQGADDYYDLPGNHDHYNDKDFAFYLNYSIQGARNGTTQVSWRKNFSFGTYHFMGICTAGNDGAPFGLFDNSYGDHAGLDADELNYIEKELQRNQDADLTLVFGHHPLPARRTSDPTDTYLTYGDPEFVRLMEDYGVSAYVYGHTHEGRKGVLVTENSDGILDINAPALGKDPGGGYQLIAIDCNGISTTRLTVEEWPVVMITAPMDIKAGADENPYAYSINDLNPKPVRALVFDTQPISRVQFRIDEGAWQTMEPAAENPNLWEAVWDEPSGLTGEHTLEVQAVGSSTRSNQITIGTVEAATPAAVENSTDNDGVGCFIGVLLP